MAGGSLLETDVSLGAGDLTQFDIDLLATTRGGVVTTFCFQHNNLIFYLPLKRNVLYVCFVCYFLLLLLFTTFNFDS